MTKEASAPPGHAHESDRETLLSSLPIEAKTLARTISDAGGRLIVVGGFVRDALRGKTSKDLDFEVYGLAGSTLGEILSGRGFTPPVGRQFPVWRHTRLGFDVSLPRADGVANDSETRGLALARSIGRNQSAPQDMPIAPNPRLFEAAARGRDLTLNAIAWDISHACWVDPLAGRKDLQNGILRAADASRFAEDPLRVLRVARLSAELGGRVDDELMTLCAAQDLSSVPVERIAGELRRILSLAENPWRAFECLHEMGQLAIFAPVAALAGVPQDPVWHPEGDVYLHTGLVVNEASKIAAKLPEDAAEVLMWSALCHDLGKAETTEVDSSGRVRSPGHDVASARLAQKWLESLKVGSRLTSRVEALCRHHLAPVIFVKDGAGPKAYRRLARKLADADLEMVDLERVARADQLGRTTQDALEGRFDVGERFLASARLASVERGVAEDVVRAADWMRAGVPAGPALGRLLRRCREVQDDTGWTAADQIMAAVSEGED